VPDEVIQDFAHALAIDVRRVGDDDGMDVDPRPPPKKGFTPLRKKVAELMREGYAAAQLLSQVRLQPLITLQWLTNTPTAARHYRAQPLDVG